MAGEGDIMAGEAAYRQQKKVSGICKASPSPFILFPVYRKCNPENI